MAKQDITVEELVRMIEKGELRLPEMQRRSSLTFQILRGICLT